MSSFLIHHEALTTVLSLQLFHLPYVASTAVGQSAAFYVHTGFIILLYIFNLLSVQEED